MVISPENWCLEDEHSCLKWSLFREEVLVSGRVTHISSWWLNGNKPNWKILYCQIGSFPPEIGVKIKSIWNHHLAVGKWIHRAPGLQIEALVIKLGTRINLAKSSQIETARNGCENKWILYGLCSLVLLDLQKVMLFGKKAPRKIFHKKKCALWCQKVLDNKIAKVQGDFWLMKPNGC